MDKITTFLNKYLTWTIYLFLFVALINGCNSCSTNREMEKNKKRIDTLTIEVSGLRKVLDQKVFSKEEMDIRMAIEGYEISKRMLYDQNAVVRTTVRPDDRMNEYDTKIKALREQLSKSQ